MKRLLYILLTLTVLLLTAAGCKNSQEEIASIVPTNEQSEPAPTLSKTKTFQVSTVDELLAAIGSNTIIELEEGSYHLNEASDYGKDSDNPAYYWEETNPGYQLVFNHLHDLTIKGTNREMTALLTSPRFANVLSLESCKRITLEGFTAGHSDGAELCSGGVINLTGCKQIQLNDMGLFGCGTVGVYADTTNELTLESTHIYDCSLYGVQAQNCRNLNVNNCSIYDLGDQKQYAAAAFSLSNCSLFNVSDSSVKNNKLSLLLEIYDSSDVTFQNTDFKENNILNSAFDFANSQPKLIDCIFEKNELRNWYARTSDKAVDKENQAIADDQFPPIKEYSKENLPKQEQIHVSTADEFLEAIGPNREIILDAELIDLSKAQGYGEITSPYFYWEDIFDGPGLVITDVNNLTIRAEGSDRKAHTISAVPRYANVLSFRRCNNIALIGFTAGHTELSGQCTGGVLDFQDCCAVSIEKCGLFGCGILGVRAQLCSDLTVKGCDIYDCSFGGIQLYEVQDGRIEGNTFRDLGGPNVLEEQCQNLICDVKTNEYPYPDVLD